MIDGLDSAQPPTPEQVGAARAAGVGLWSGYLATRPGVNLLRPWSEAEFDVARLAGGTPIAFCSGWDDPAACRDLAAAWDVRLCLDVEDAIRGDGPWVQLWLDDSGAGLYGDCGVHDGRRAAFRVLAWYPIVPVAGTWNDVGCPPRPAGPCGWQSQGSHQEFGLDVDRGWYDDWFGGAMTPEEHGWLADVTTWVDQVAGPNLAAIMAARPAEDQWRQQVTAQLQSLGAPALAQLAQDVADLRATLDRIENALKGA